MSPRNRPPAPDLVFIKLQDALAATGCPICRIVRQAEQRYLWGYLYEQVNDPHSREEFIAARGFCADHARALLAFHDVLGVAILYRHLVGELTAALERASSAAARTLRAAAQRIAAALAPDAGCPACRHVRLHEDALLHALVVRLEPPEVWERLCGPAALCVRHFLAALRVADRAAQARLVQAELTALRAVARDLDELIRKFDYRFRHETVTPDEAASWTRAIELCAGAGRVWPPT
ncbi:MAG TPA: DUF6062 family protein [bacterium]|nr:DUF6062 family protein [bacterium]